MNLSRIINMTLPKTLTPSIVTGHVMAVPAASADTPYIGEPVSQLEHSLQCAQQALNASNPFTDDETIVASLLHDIGQFAPEDELEDTVRDMDTGAGSVGRYSHDELGARYLRGLGFPEKMCTLVGEHVNAKRYLCGINPAYFEKLSEASKESLGFQGGPMDSEERRIYEEALGSDTVKDVVRIRKWDDGGKVVGAEAQGLERYRGLIQNVLERDGWNEVEE